MAEKTWTLTDIEQDIYVEQVALGPNDVGGDAANYLVSKRTLRGGRRDGVDVVEVSNGTFPTPSGFGWLGGRPRRVRPS